MADNITLNSGSGGATLATDDAGAGGHVQVVKLAVSTDGSATALTADNTNGLLADVKRVQGNVTVVGAAADNATLSGNPVLVAGSDGTNAQSISVTAGGLVQVHDGGGTLSIDDGGGAITVDGTVAVSGTVSVDDGAGSLTVDGTVAATQSGTWNVTNVSGTVSLPTGAATAAKQPALGTAGTASSDVITVQGIASMTPLQVADNGGTLSIDDGGGAITVDGTVAVSGTVAVTDNAGSLTVDAPVGTPVFVRLSDGAAAISALPVTDNAGSLTVDNGGTFAVQESGSALTALQKIDDPVLVDDAAFTPATSSVMMAGFQADETSTDSVNEGDAGAVRMTLDRKLIVTPQPHTAGGLTIFRSLDIDETEEDVKTSAGQLYSIAAFNRTAAPVYLKFYNATAANVTVGTTTPVLTFVVPGNADSDGAGFIIEKQYGWTFDTAICVAATTGIADNDTGAPAANDCVIDLGYI